MNSSIRHATRTAPVPLRVPPPSRHETLGIFAGHITAVNGSTNATYNAVANHDQSISVTAGTPLDRGPISTTDGGTYTAKSVGNPVILLQHTDGTVYIANAWEVMSIIECPEPA